MDFNRLIERVRKILLTPNTEWPVIAAEPTTTSQLYTNYILILAAIPALAGFIKGSIIGFGVPFVGTGDAVVIMEDDDAASLDSACPSSAPCAWDSAPASPRCCCNTAWRSAWCSFWH